MLILLAGIKTPDDQRTIQSRPSSYQNQISAISSMTAHQFLRAEADNKLSSQAHDAAKFFCGDLIHHSVSPLFKAAFFTRSEKTNKLGSSVIESNSIILEASVKSA